ncbi:DUF397 domain-containing protein [Streptomyces sp. NBC_00466]|uniref:DUF397 domain-containing protein n=1 Tax=Streptomyces sp. NBC_00466 TaxID=2903655 RepID=UPI00352D7B19
MPRSESHGGSGRRVAASAASNTAIGAAPSRLARQAVLECTDSPWVWIVLDEAVLYRVLGGGLVMRDQLARLLDLGKRPRIHVQVLPFGTTDPAAMGGSFTLLALPDGREVGYEEGIILGRLVEDADEVMRRTVLLRSAASQCPVSGGISAVDPNGDGGVPLMRAARVDPADAQWRKSTYSNGQGGDCLEVADGVSSVVPVRDSKNPAGPGLVFPGAAWAVFIDAVRRD